MYIYSIDFLFIMDYLLLLCCIRQLISFNIWIPFPSLSLIRVQNCFLQLPLPWRRQFFALLILPPLALYRSHSFIWDSSHFRRNISLTGGVKAQVPKEDMDWMLWVNYWYPFASNQQFSVDILPLAWLIFLSFFSINYFELK